MLKPLDGSPLMSENCWRAILNSVNERAKAEKKVRCLEWGAGNSTIGFVRSALNMKDEFELVSVEHQTTFFPYLTESVIDTFLGSKNKTGLKISWASLEKPAIKLSQLKDVLKRHQNLKNSSLTWQILTGNKRLQYAEQFRPDFSPSLYKRLKQSVKFALITLAYWTWIVQAVIRPQKNPVFKEVQEDFPRKFLHNPEAGCLSIKNSKITVTLWHLPEIRNFFWNRGLLLDGSIFQLPDFVDVPIGGQFDIIFIDGRARVSCMKRVYYDKLLKDQGYLFVHDAYRTEMAEAFKLFGPTHTFLQGSNITLNGKERCHRQFGFPLVQVGDSKETLRWKIMQELFVYQNT